MRAFTDRDRLIERAVIRARRSGSALMMRLDELGPVDSDWVARAGALHSRWLQFMKEERPLSVESAMARSASLSEDLGLDIQMHRLAWDITRPL